MRKYPKRRNGDEYYPSSVDGFTSPFVENEHGKEIYARDRRGNELYPKVRRSATAAAAAAAAASSVFARDVTGDGYYAKDSAGDEYYPVLGNRSLFLTDPLNQNVVRIALCADGTQRYPRDGKGNEYYWKEDGRPSLMRKKSGETYLARSRNGHAMIPWNYLQEYVGEEPCIYSKDSEGNTVYLTESAFPPAYQAIVRCVCNLSVLCPNLTGCHTRFY